MAVTMPIAEAVQSLIDSAADKIQFDKSIENLKLLPSAELLVVCMQALSREPEAGLIRLQLAKVMLQFGCYSFAIDQLKILKERFASQALNDLINKLEQVYATDAEQSAPLASLDFDIELLDSDKD